MNNNDVLRRLRYILEFNDENMIQIFSHAHLVVSRDEIISWLKPEDSPDFKACDDRSTASFLNGLIVELRGKKEGAPPPQAEDRLNNNIILRKLKIAFDLKGDDMVKIMDIARFRISKHEISAFFRKVGHKHYRQCQDQVLRYFLTGLQKMAEATP